MNKTKTILANNDQYIQPINPDSCKLLSLNKAAATLGIRQDTLKQLISDGIIKVLVINKRFKISLFEIGRYIKESAITVNLTPKKKAPFNIESILNRKNKAEIDTTNLFNKMIKERENGKRIS